MNVAEEPVITTGWTWTKDELGYHPITAKVIDNNGWLLIETVEVNTALSMYAKPGSRHSMSVLKETPDQVFEELEKRHVAQVKRAKAELCRAERDLAIIRQRREDCWRAEALGL